MKLTTLSKILIVLALMVVLFFVFKKYLPKTETAENEAEKIENTENVQTEEAENVVQPETAIKKFEYTPEAPVNGKLKGVVELGAAGFNSFIIRIDKNKNWTLEKAEFGNSLVYDGMAIYEDVRNGLKKYISGMLDFGVPGKEIHFVVSSGAKSVPATQMIIDELKKMKYFVNEVTPEKEAQLALKSVLPKGFESNAFVVDIGSGNTKISWMEGNKIIGKETFGAKYYNNNTPDAEVATKVKEISKTVPSDKTEYCFIIGGIPFELAKQGREGEERYTVLKNPGEYKAEGAKMKSGLNIYKNIIEGTGCKTFVFDWHANFTIGFLLTL